MLLQIYSISTYLQLKPDPVMLDSVYGLIINSPCQRKCVSYTSSAVDLCESDLTAVLSPKRINGIF